MENSKYYYKCVNLGLTFRNQFQALAFSHNEDIELTLKNWVSDAGDAGIS